MLITIAVVGVLFGVLLPALRMGLTASRSYKCQASMRAIAFDFIVFADSELHGSRGDDGRKYGSERFSLETFIESQYGIDEFWTNGAESATQTRAASTDDPMRCSEVTGDLTLRRDVPCREGAVSPTQNVSYGFNLRLSQQEYTDSRGRPRVRDVVLRSKIAGEQRVPLVIDINGETAGARGVVPHFVGPSLDSAGPFAGDRYWFPSSRHGGRTNVALVDGSVAASRELLKDSALRWDYEPTP